MTQDTVTLNELLATQAFLKSQIASLTEERNALPRNDKKNAHRLLHEILKLQAEEKGMRPSIARVRGEEERREHHHLWCMCIAELYGEEDLQLCFEWMKQEKRKRREDAQRSEA
jgi:hypothetical protein